VLNFFNIFGGKMIYQLPNGKVIHITIEEYLDLTDQDIQYLMSQNAGNYASSPWYKSSIKKKGKPQVEEDKSLDYSPEYDEPLHGDSIEEDIEDEYPDIADNIEEIE
jgi:hypothetical protein